MRLILVNSAGQKLSGFYPNDVKPKLAYRKNGYYCYPTLEEAQEHLAYIQGYGLGKNLRIETEWESKC